jgi:hypothetical protein
MSQTPQSSPHQRSKNVTTRDPPLAPNQTTTMARTKAAKERYAATRAFAHPKKTIEARVTKKLKKPQPNQSHKLTPGKGLKL